MMSSASNEPHAACSTVALFVFVLRALNKQNRASLSNWIKDILKVICDRQGNDFKSQYEGYRLVVGV